MKSDPLSPVVPTPDVQGVPAQPVQRPAPPDIPPPTAAPEMLTEKPGEKPSEKPGQRLARGVTRALLAMDVIAMEEVVLANGLRADLMGLGPKDEIWIVECKSCRADFRADRKWQGYLDYCDRFFWAVGPDFPADLLPDDCGLILADAWGGEMMRPAPLQPLAPARRKVVTRMFARQAALRLTQLRDTRR